jgi:hypothetical protein
MVNDTRNVYLESAIAEIRSAALENPNRSYFIVTRTTAATKEILSTINTVAGVRAEAVYAIDKLLDRTKKVQRLNSRETTHLVATQGLWSVWTSKFLCMLQPEAPLTLMFTYKLTDRERSVLESSRLVKAQGAALFAPA